MDLRIVNTCNNDCLYCLEGSLRKKEKFISTQKIFQKISEETNKDNIAFFWGNPLLHPDFLKIVEFSKSQGFDSIWFLTNGFWISHTFLEKFKQNWWTTIWFYFHSFDETSHDIITGKSGNYWNFLNNLKLISASWLNSRCIIHINNGNITNIAKDVLLIFWNYKIDNFDFVNYFPFDKPYINRKYLDYSIEINGDKIDLLFKVLLKTKVTVNFMKFPKEFFWKYQMFYNFEKWVISQIWDEDYERLDTDTEPFCYEEKRCNSCFIKDHCKFYKKIKT